MNEQPVILSARSLAKTYKRTIHAVRDVSFDLRRGETLGVVGESGCGKSTTTRMVLGLEHPDRGSVVFDGVDVHRTSRAQMRLLRRRIQLVPQNPQTSFNPRLTIDDSIQFSLAGQGVPRRSRDRRIVELFDRVGLTDRHRWAYPHELSGGQLQRAAIARALGPRPEVIVCDEAVSALDKSVQAQVLNLLSELQTETGAAMLFISHDLGVVEHMSDRLLVMFAGTVVETGPARDVYDSPQHEYTRTLLDSVLH